MIVSKTPLRIPLAGGLTDLKGYAERFGGVTVSATIDKYVYVLLKENLGGYLRLKYADVQEKVRDVHHVKHDLIREALLLTGLEGTPLDLVVMADVAGESGLGASGALAVGLLNALHAFKGEQLSKARLVEEATHLEVDLLGGGGYHDASICALGGLKRLEYAGNRVTPHDVPLSPQMRAAFERSPLLFYSGRHARSKPSLDLLSSHLEEALPTLHKIKALGYELERAFSEGDVPHVARCVGTMQDLKQLLPGLFVDDYVRNVVRRVRAAGAFAQIPGGKISAFVLVCCPGSEQGAVRTALQDLREVTVRLEQSGAQVIAV